MSLGVEWTANAIEDLQAIGWQDAAWIAAEVARYADHGIGDLRRVRFPTGGQGLVFFLPGYRVWLTFDRGTRTLWVWRVARAVPS